MLDFLLHVVIEFLLSLAILVSFFAALVVVATPIVWLAALFGGGPFFWSIRRGYGQVIALGSAILDAID